jgi:PP-loop superfamily ATP-utilizing enzyme
VRVRHHHNKARVEVAEEDVSRLLSDEVSERVRGHLLDLGFPDVELSASGYRGPSTL